MLAAWHSVHCGCLPTLIGVWQCNEVNQEYSNRSSFFETALSIPLCTTGSQRKSQGSRDSGCGFVLIQSIQPGPGQGLHERCFELRMRDLKSSNFSTCAVVLHLKCKISEPMNAFLTGSPLFILPLEACEFQQNLLTPEFAKSHYTFSHSHLNMQLGFLARK